MKLLIILSFILLSCLPAKTQLQHSYFVKNDYVFLCDLVKNCQKDIKLFSIDKNRHSLRVKTTKLLNTLQKLGYKDISSKYNYTQFTKKSPINTEKIKLYIKKFYQEHYKNIVILEVKISPRSYLDVMPKNYTIQTNNKSYLSSTGIVNLKTDDNKKIFFNYLIRARITVVLTKENIHKDSELSLLNSKKKSIMLKKFRAMPLQEIEQSSFQLKHNVKKDTILTLRDITPLFLVKRGSTIQVIVKDSNIAISFRAKAKQNGRLGESITIENSQGRRLKAVVTAKNSAEIK